MLTSLDYLPTTSPLDPGFIYRHLRIANADDFALADGYVLVATELVENYLSRFLINRQVLWTVADERQALSGQSWTATMLPWQWSSYIASPTIELPRPASAIASVVIGVWGAADVTLVEGTDFVADLTVKVARVRWTSDLYWTYLKDHLQVSFTSGFGPTAASVPLQIKHAVALITGALFESRGDAMPDLEHAAIGALLASYRLVSFG